MRLSNIIGGQNNADDENWISVSDMMAGLMVIFLFIAVIYIRPVVEKILPIVERQNKIKEIAVTFNKFEVDIGKALEKEFKKDMKRWNAELDHKTLAIRFKSPEVLFDTGTSDLKPQFQEILSDFFPRYVEVLHNFKDAIAEVRIEGHTSSVWIGAGSKEEAYFNNMRLSQARTRSVLEYSFGLDMPIDFSMWARNLITANGLSSSQPIMSNNQEDKKASRRVEFRVRTNAKERIVRILEIIE